jgi:hypothetical protein
MLKDIGRMPAAGISVLYKISKTLKSEWTRDVKSVPTYVSKPVEESSTIFQSCGYGYDIEWMRPCGNIQWGRFFLN